MSTADLSPTTDLGSRSTSVETDHPRATRFHLTMLLAALVLCYTNSLWGVFVFDDHSNIVVNRSLRTFFGPPEYIPVSLHHRTVARGTFALNYMFSGLNTTGYHVVNIFIHASAAWILYLLVRDTIRLENNRLALGLGEDRYKSASANLAFAVALLWMVHPLQTQAVTYISQRIESLMGLFFLVTMYCMLRGATSERSNKWYAGGIIALALGVGTKEVAAMALPVTLLFDRIFLASSWAEIARRRGWVYSAFLVPIAGLAWQLLTFHPEGNDAGLYFSGVSRSDYLFTQPQILLHYLRLVFWPSTLCFDYGWPVATKSAEIYPAALAIIGLLAMNIVLLFYTPRVAFFGLAFFLILSPTSSVIPIADLAFEHRMYLPLAAIVTLVVTGIYSLISAARNPSTFERREQLGLLLLLVIALSLAGRTILRNRDYRSDLTLWQSTLSARPTNARAAQNVGNALLIDGKAEESLPYFDRALELRTDYPIAYRNRAIAYDKLGRSDDAIRDLDRAIELEPRFLRAYIQRGDIYFRQEKYAIAVQDYTKHVELDPNYVPMLVKRGITWRKLGEFEKSLADFSQALRLSPHNAPAIYHRGKLFLVQKNADEAAKDVAELFKLAPQAGESFALRAELEQLRGNFAAALEDFETAIECKPKDASIHEGLAALLAGQKRFDEAWTSLEMCRKLGGKPDPALVAVLEKERSRHPSDATGQP